jgi:hypothetical protein
MADELSQLDEIVESDILDALGEKTVPPSSTEETTNAGDDITEDDIKIEDFIEGEENSEEDNIVVPELEKEIQEETTTVQKLEDDAELKTLEDEIKIEDFVEETTKTEEPVEIDETEDTEETSEETQEEISDASETLTDETPIEPPTVPSSQQTIEVESSSIVSIINELLKNKTIEITIKIKD